jgi:hypothetical protein
MNCGFPALAIFGPSGSNRGEAAHQVPFEMRGCSVKKIALALALVVAGLSLGGCFVGKGKAPAPVITKG